MFQEEYKKKYDQLHPSAELIEQTKKLALEKWEEQPEDMELESFDPWNEEDSKFGRHKRWIRIAGAMAAGVAIVVSGVYLGNSLQPKSEKGLEVAKNVEVTATATVCPEETPVVQKKESNASKKNKVEQKNTVHINTRIDTMTKLAQMERGSVTMDYASADRVIFHGNFGIIIYSISGKSVVETISTSQYDKDGNGVHIEVNTDGSKILWYSSGTLADDAKIYKVGSGQATNIDSEDFVWEEEIFGKVQNVAGTNADVYVDASRTGEMVAIGDGRYLQLIYQVPESSLQASLAVSIIDLNTKTEQLYSIFGETGKNIEEKQGRKYGNYHNEQGIALFENVAKDEPAQEEIKDTLLPEQTEEPEETPVVEETMEPLVEETEIPPEQ